MSPVSLVYKYNNNVGLATMSLPCRSFIGALDNIATSKFVPQVEAGCKPVLLSIDHEAFTPLTQSQFQHAFKW